MTNITRRQFVQQFAVAGTLVVRTGVASTRQIRRFETRGDGFARGKQQGQACRDVFLPWMDRLLKERAKRLGLSSRAEYVSRVRREVDRWRDYMEAADHQAFEECRGLQAALGVDEPTYFATHFNTELPNILPQCTVVGLRDSDGRPLVGKTDDVAEWEVGMNVLEMASPNRGYRHAHFHFAGTIWTVAGMNEKGLSMGMNGIPAPVVEGAGLSSLTALHTILPNCATVANAIEYIRGLRLNCGGFSLLLGDATGAIALVEKTAAGTAVLPEQQKGTFVHANDILDAGFAAKNPPSSEPIETNSHRRYENALRRVKAGVGIEQILTDRTPRGAICQRGEDGMYTDFAVIFASVERKFKFWPGPVGIQVAETVELAKMSR